MTERANAFPGLDRKFIMTIRTLNVVCTRENLFFGILVYLFLKVFHESVHIRFAVKFVAAHVVSSFPYVAEMMVMHTVYCKIFHKSNIILQKLTKLY